MRAVGDPDAFPASDLGLRRALDATSAASAAAGRPLAPLARLRSRSPVDLVRRDTGHGIRAPLAGQDDGRRIAAR